MYLLSSKIFLPTLQIHLKVAELGKPATLSSVLSSN